MNRTAKQIAEEHYRNRWSNWFNEIEALTKEIEEYAAQQVAKNLHKSDVIKSVCEHKWKLMEDVKGFEYNWCHKCGEYK